MTMFYCQVQRAFRSIWRCCSARNLFVVNCVVSIANVLFYTANHTLLFGSFESRFLAALDSESQALLDRTFRVFVEAMASANISFFIFSGTLLGSFRHLGPIPWDDDIDVLINNTDQDRVVEALTALDPLSFGLYAPRSDAAADYVYQWKFYSRSGRGMFYTSYRTPYIDIFFFYENRTHIWNGSPQFVASEVWPKSVVYPLRRRPFGELFVQAPCNTEAFLARNFDLSTCQSRVFSHTFDVHFLSAPLSVPCERLHHLYPFVRRTVQRTANGSWSHEALVYRGVTLRQVTATTSC